MDPCKCEKAAACHSQSNAPATKNRLQSYKLWLVVSVSLVCVLIIGVSAVLTVKLQNVDNKLDWVAFQGSYPNKKGSMHEESDMDAERRTILHVNAEGWRIGVNNSISLHDYEQGLLATKVMETGSCMIIDLIDSYEEASAALERFRQTGESGDRPVREFNGATLIADADLEKEVGAKLALFCRGSPAHRLQEMPEGTLDMEREERAKADARNKRGVRLSTGTVSTFRAEAVCVGNTFEVEYIYIRRG